MNSTLSITQINTFKSCQFKHSLQYKEGLAPAREKADAMHKGGVVHKLMSAALKAQALGSEPFEAMQRVLTDVTADKFPHYKLQSAIAASIGLDFNDEWETLYNEAFDVAVKLVDELQLGKKYEVLTVYNIYQYAALTTGYYNPHTKIADQTGIDKHKTKDLTDWNVLDYHPFIEFPVAWKIDQATLFNGYADALLFDIERGILVLVDWKTKQSFNKTDTERLDLQLPAYIYTLRQSGIPVQWSVTYQVKSTVPKRDETEFSKPITVFHSDKTLEIAWQQIQASAKAIRSVKKPLMALGFNCKTCQFQKYCTELMSGFDPEYTIPTEYVRTREILTEETE